ncbi:hypothetical protein MF6396_03130 [Pseudomonas sp. MF6396]|uniref:hypothetical protein n=1 Tax=Pseudomonas sp. MF6396 TaxID=1960828 RepID=UPI0009979459|nr:hypothetical protein [Pseudomonas sp. MF6396]OOW06655.1 hypothetical protein MF6396_03130 [Pseudomonas sp. MF6396]
MTDITRQTPDEKMIEITAEFFAARLVLGQSHRASRPEIDRAQKMNDSLTNFLIGGGYAPNLAHMGTMPQNADGSFIVVIGQDGVLPLADKVGTYRVSGEAIKSVMASHYSKWLQTWG